MAMGRELLRFLTNPRTQVGLNATVVGILPGLTGKTHPELMPPHIYSKSTARQINCPPRMIRDRNRHRIGSGHKARNLPSGTSNRGKTHRNRVTHHRPRHRHCRRGSGSINEISWIIGDGRRQMLCNVCSITDRQTLARNDSQSNVGGLDGSRRCSCSQVRRDTQTANKNGVTP